MTLAVVNDMQMNYRRTRTGARRSGDDYQDMVAAAALVRVLQHPSRYVWVKFEAREAGKLDDLLVLRADGVVEATQTRFSTDILRPGDPWTWKTLLSPPGKGERSLVQMWCESVARLDHIYGATEPRLLSNREAGDDLVLNPQGYVDQGRTDPAILEQVSLQLGGLADDFLQRFRFRVGEQGLTDLEENLFEQFQSLGLAERNWLSLKEAIRSWIRGEGLPSSGEIHLEDIRRACGWRQLNPLPQDLEVPPDYTLPLPQFHTHILERIKEGSLSPIVVTAEPGVGKSTYLSFLVEALRKLDCPVVRHHYSLRPPDDHADRLDAHRVAESLMADLQDELPTFNQEFGGYNPSPDMLGDWLRKIGDRLQEQGKQLVVIVDGLDHVWRAEQSQEELKKLFRHLLPVPSGVVLLLGTQRVDDLQLPATLLSVAPKEDWLDLPRFDTQAIREWLGYHRGLMPDEWENNYDLHISRLAHSLYSRTQGHPLLLRYTVEAIAARGDLLTDQAVETVPGSPAKSLEAYYSSLWLGLSPEAKDVMFLLAIARFSWPQEGLYQCLRVAGYEQSSSARGVEAVRHLLGRDALGLFAFHSSVLVYARHRPEFADCAPRLRQATIEWLANRAPRYWRESHLWLLQLEAGGAEPLLEGSNRSWVIEAISNGHPISEVRNVLEAAAWEALRIGDYSTYVDRGILADVVRACLYHSEALHWLFSAQLQLSADEFLVPRSFAQIKELDDIMVWELALHMRTRGSHDELVACFDEINRRLGRETDDLQSFEERMTRVEICTELAAVAGVSPSRFLPFLNGFPSEVTKTLVTKKWISGLRRSLDVHSAVQVLRASLDTSVRQHLSRHVAIVGARESIWLPAPDFERLASPYASVYKLFIYGELDSTLPNEPLLMARSRDFAWGEYTTIVDSYVHDLFFFLFIRELQEPGFAGRWTPPAGLTPWLMSAMKAIVVSARDVAVEWRHSRTVLVTAPYTTTRSLKVVHWNDATDDRESSAGIRDALRGILEDLLYIRQSAGGSLRLSLDEVSSICSHQLAGLEQLLGWICEGTVEIEDENIDLLCTLLDNQLRTTIEPFDERATKMAMLAKICASYQSKAYSQYYRRRSTDNLIAYGSHKDLLLDVVLNAIESSANCFTTLKDFWFKLAPAISTVGDFTDGDETRHLPTRLGTLLLTVDPAIASVYIGSLMDTEHYHIVEDVLEYIVSNGDLSDPIVRALVSTCIEPQSIRILERRASDSNAFARQVLEVQPRFCQYPIEAEDESSKDDSVFNPSTRGNQVLQQPTWSSKYSPQELYRLIESGLRSKPRSTIASELCSWLNRWSETGHAEDALKAVEPYFFENDWLPVTNEMVALVRKIRGRRRSYAWIVQAQRVNHGWSDYWTRLEESNVRWEWVRQDFPDCWHGFLVESMQPPRGFSPVFGTTMGRLVQYLVHFARCAEAAAVTSQLVETVEGLVSGQELPVPSWIATAYESHT